MNSPFNDIWKVRLEVLKLNFKRIPYFLFLRSLIFVKGLIVSSIITSIEYFKFLLSWDSGDRPPFGILAEDELQDGEVMDEDYQPEEEKSIYNTITPSQYFVRELKKQVHPSERKRKDGEENQNTWTVPNSYLKLFYNETDFLWKWEIGLMLRIVLFYVLYSMWGKNILYSDKINSKRPYFDDSQASEFYTDLTRSCLINSMRTNNSKSSLQRLVKEDMQKKYFNTLHLFDNKLNVKLCEKLFSISNDFMQIKYSNEDNYNKCIIDVPWRKQLNEVTKYYPVKLNEVKKSYSNYIKNNPKYWKLVDIECYPNKFNTLTKNKIKTKYYEWSVKMRAKPDSLSEIIYRSFYKSTNGRYNSKRWK